MSERQVVRMDEIKYATIDRFEEEKAIIEKLDDDGKPIMLTVLRNDLPKNAAPGDKIYKNKSGKWIVDKERTEDEQKRIRSLMDSLFE